ncbi:beta-N-acetylhexosaminidase [Microbacterium sp. Gd 4-13]|uniref:glycoside hydrolase family 3 N-terminal domain-containing protein n=1 Tax=Microbacterium sp. Gd 4-13 TaxID=2173179 RepID=UPI000D56E3BB|nr:glycoside hydrolase family 3 N-terminal domain-containing protein [Microbacterium sp. Gd 4-13]PVW03683.1 beta-N-acetylhexosaminidase [Microbacterium sp. Gd 4-13]
MTRILPPAALAVVALLGLVGCAAASPSPTAESSSRAPSTAAPASPTVTPTPVDPIADLSLEQRVGQLFMVGTSVGGPDPITLEAVSQQHVGGIFLHGRSSAGVEAAAAFVKTFEDAHLESVPPLWIATDQEGGDVQVLSGPGFDSMPTALTQARSDTATLETDATRWGAQLAQAGVNMNLAPVADIVTSAEAGPQNPPIGALNREYGFDRATVADKAGAFAAGMRTSGVMPTLKHFPGLGRATQNTDTRSGVVDDVVGADSADVAVYGDLLAEGPAVVMMSTAVYARIDPAAPAAFSPTVVTGLLREQLGFEGVVTTDDLSAAAQIRDWAPGDRALLSIEAGVDLVLVSADPTVFPEMYAAVLSRAQTDDAFAAKVDAAARRVVEAKASLG